MTQALKRAMCTVAGVVLLHASDLSPLWLFEPYRQRVNAMLMSHPIAPVIFLILIFAALTILVGCLSEKSNRQTTRVA